ncbi:hypothetical protein O987_07045 [Comamonas testosteroni TK102]|uniref:Uncharacterized protein n=1 Tax=Comamonas testosteroni TK102 TaxID=1392005 RepID=A0A076PIW4_COMTE|nr:hypothetical protein [Comamonas testosteroni]AIJ45553.1 hypothetical protein O987_07045 [Comamonas testosteroni TK102]
MARIEHIKRRLDNWALWKARLNSTGLGFHSVNVLAVDVWSRNSYNGSMIPHIDQEGEETDQAVEALKPGKIHLYQTLHAYYLQDLGVQLIARSTGKSPSTIHAHFDQADHFIAGWLQEQARMREEKEALARGREYMAKQGSLTP